MRAYTRANRTAKQTGRRPVGRPRRRKNRKNQITSSSSRRTAEKRDKTRQKKQTIDEHDEQDNEQDRQTDQITRANQIARMLDNIDDQDVQGDHYDRDDTDGPDDPDYQETDKPSDHDSGVDETNLDEETAEFEGTPMETEELEEIEEIEEIEENGEKEETGRTEETAENETTTGELAGTRANEESDSEGSDYYEGHYTVNYKVKGQVLKRKYEYYDRRTEFTMVIDTRKVCWFKAVDFLKLMNYRNKCEVLSKYVSPENKKRYHELTNYRDLLSPQTHFINEKGLKEMLSGGSVRHKTDMKRWVDKIFFPHLRKMGLLPQVQQTDTVKRLCELQFDWELQQRCRLMCEELQNYQHFLEPHKHYNTICSELRKLHYLFQHENSAAIRQELHTLKYLMDDDVESVNEHLDILQQLITNIHATDIMESVENLELLLNQSIHQYTTLYEKLENLFDVFSSFDGEDDSDSDSDEEETLYVYTSKKNDDARSLLPIAVEAKQHEKMLKEKREQELRSRGIHKRTINETNSIKVDNTNKTKRARTLKPVPLAERQLKTIKTLKPKTTKPSEIKSTEMVTSTDTITPTKTNETGEPILDSETHTIDQNHTHRTRHSKNLRNKRIRRTYGNPKSHKKRNIHEKQETDTTKTIEEADSTNESIDVETIDEAIHSANKNTNDETSEIEETVELVGQMVKKMVNEMAETTRNETVESSGIIETEEEREQHERDRNARSQRQRHQDEREKLRQLRQLLTETDRTFYENLQELLRESNEILAEDSNTSLDDTVEPPAHHTETIIDSSKSPNSSSSSTLSCSPQILETTDEELLRTLEGEETETADETDGTTNEKPNNTSNSKSDNLDRGRPNEKSDEKSNEKSDEKSNEKSDEKWDEKSESPSIYCDEKLGENDEKDWDDRTAEALAQSIAKMLKRENDIDYLLKILGDSIEQTNKPTITKVEMVDPTDLTALATTINADQTKYLLEHTNKTKDNTKKNKNSKTNRKTNKKTNNKNTKLSTDVLVLDQDGNPVDNAYHTGAKAISLTNDKLDHLHALKLVAIEDDGDQHELMYVIEDPVDPRNTRPQTVTSPTLNNIEHSETTTPQTIESQEAVETIETKVAVETIMTETTTTATNNTADTIAESDEPTKHTEPMEIEKLCTEQQIQTSNAIESNPTIEYNEGPEKPMLNLLDLFDEPLESDEDVPIWERVEPYRADQTDQYTNFQAFQTLHETYPPHASPNTFYHNSYQSDSNLNHFYHRSNQNQNQSFDQTTELNFEHTDQQTQTALRTTPRSWSFEQDLLEHPRPVSTPEMNEPLELQLADFLLQ